MSAFSPANAEAVLAHMRSSVEELQRAVEWSAWKLGERESYPIPLDDPNGLQAALDQAVTDLSLYRGDTLAVMCAHGGRRENTLWIYTIKQESKPVFRRDPATGEAVRTQRLYPALVCETKVEAFVPVRRFDAFRDDAVGVDRTLVEVRP